MYSYQIINDNLYNAKQKGLQLISIKSVIQFLGPDLSNKSLLFKITA